MTSSQRRVGQSQSIDHRARGGRVRVSRIKVFERDPYELAALMKALLLHFRFPELPIKRAPEAEWTQQLRDALPDRSADVYYVLRPPEGPEILPRALCVAVGREAVAAVVRRVKEDEEPGLVGSESAAFNEPESCNQPDFPGIGDLSEIAPSGRFIGSDELVLQAQDGNQMWRAICQRAGVKSMAVGDWGAIDRSLDRDYNVRHVLRYGVPSNSANIAGLRSLVGNERAEIWEIEALRRPWSLRIAAINYRTLAAIQWVKR